MNLSRMSCLRIVSMKNNRMTRRDFVKVAASAPLLAKVSSQLRAQGAEGTDGSLPANAKPFEFPRGERQLFLDGRGVANLQKVAKTLHQPLKRGAVIRPDPLRGVTYLQTRSAPQWDPQANRFRFWIENQPDDAR